MTVKLPGKAGFAPTVAEWDALVRIAENLAAQVVQAQAERDAARAEVARLTAALESVRGAVANNERHLDIVNEINAALRQPAPATAWCNCGMGDGTMPELHSAWCDVQKPAPATAKE